jgi:hypothetical protein
VDYLLQHVALFVRIELIGKFLNNHRIQRRAGNQSIPRLMTAGPAAVILSFCIKNLIENLIQSSTI